MGRREEKKAEKRQRIEHAALTLFLEHGFERASIEQVIQGADIARGTFYLYYPDKLSLFVSIQQRWLSPMFEELRGVHDRLHDATDEASCIAIYQDLALRLAALGLGRDREILLGLQELLSKHEAGIWMREHEAELQILTTHLTQIAIDRGLILPVQPKLAALIITGAVERLFYEVVTGTDLGSPAEIAQQATIILSRVLGLGLK